MSESVSNDLNEQVTDIIDDAEVVTVPIDTTLSIGGEAADAKAVGDALALKADKSELANAITVNGQSADAQGAILVTAEEIDMSDSDTTTVAAAIAAVDAKTGATIPVDATTGAQSIKDAIESAAGATAQTIPMSSAEGAVTIASKIATMDLVDANLQTGVTAANARTGADIPVSAAPGAETIQEAVAAVPLTVNNTAADENRNIQIDEVPWAANLSTSAGVSAEGTYIQRSTGGSASIENGDGWLMNVKGNRVHVGFVAQSVTMTVTQAEREEGADGIEATIDEDAFIAEMSSASGTFNFIYYSGAWSYEPSEYGITVTGTPINNDTISVAYTKEVRGTITQSDPQSFVSTGWNLYRESSSYTGYTGYAKVVKYSETYGFKVGGTYTSLAYSATIGGTPTALTVSGGAFVVPGDGYVFVAGGSTDTIIYMTWNDWTEEANGGIYAAYTETEVDLSNVMETYFPNGLMRVGDVRDEIDLNTGYAISRVERMAYSAENRAAAEETGRTYEFDENYIYLERDAAVTNAISVDGGYTANDHGIEYFTGTDVGVLANTYYGSNLRNKLERDVLTVSQQTLTDAQKTQARTNIGAGSAADLATLNSKIATSDVSSSITVTSTTGTISQKTAYRTGNVVSLAFVLTLTTTVSSASLGCSATFANGASALKPANRQPGASNDVNVLGININPSTSGADLNARTNVTKSSGSAIWLAFTYICEG